MFRPVDPWRTLQVPHDASLDEVKAAYRKLAKLYHPDSAGEKAVPRFLAIQAAYEELTTGPGRLRLGAGSRSPRQPTARPRRASPASGQPRPTSGPAAEPHARASARPGGANQRGASQGGATAPGGRSTSSAG